MGEAPPDDASLRPRHSKVVRKAKGLRRRAVRRWKILKSPRAGYLDLNHDYHRTLLLVSSARSGSTWLSDILEETLRCRMIFEPLRRDRVPLARDIPWGRYSVPGQPDPALDDVMRRILTGRVRSQWSDKFNRYRLPHHRLVKEVRATNLLPRLTTQYPGMPIVFLLRHPVPTAWSAAELYWKPYLNEFLRQPLLMDGPLAELSALITEEAAVDDLFHKHVLRWCLENYVPVQQLATGSVHVVFYESIVEDPDRELERLSRYLEQFSAAGWSFTAGRPSALDLPSRANYRGTPVMAAEKRLRSWCDDVPPEAVARALELIGRFGLDRIYGTDVRPLLTPDEVLLG
jgi:sulfotransferase family protein